MDASHVDAPTPSPLERSSQEEMRVSEEIANISSKEVVGGTPEKGSRVVD